MPVQLKDAEIKVKLDLSDADKAGGTLEEKTKRDRERRDRDAKREKDRERRSGRGGRGGGSRGGSIRRMVGAGALASGFRGLLHAAGTVALPVGLEQTIGLAAKAAVATALTTMAIGEMEEHFGPFVRGMIKEALPPKMKPLLDVLDLAGGSGQWWIDLKNDLKAFTEAVQQTKQTAGALGIAGEDITGGLLADIFKEERAAAAHRIMVERNKMRIQRELIGGGIGRAIQKVTDQETQKKLEAGINK